MKTTAQEAADQNRGERKKILILAGAAAALLIVGVVAVILLAGRGRATVKGTLEEYFGTMYTTNGKGFDEMTDCFAPDLQETWYNSMTLQGMNFSQLVNWRLEATEQVGDNARLTAKVSETANDSATDLVAMRQTYAEAQAVCEVIFQLEITGDTGSLTTHGAVGMVKLDGKWYFTNTSIPMTPDSRTGSAQEWYDKYGDKTEGAGN